MMWTNINEEHSSYTRSNEKRKRDERPKCVWTKIEQKKICVAGVNEWKKRQLYVHIPFYTIDFSVFFFFLFFFWILSYFCFVFKNISSNKFDAIKGKGTKNCVALSNKILYRLNEKKIYKIKMKWNKMKKHPNILIHITLYTSNIRYNVKKKKQV